jgi:ABC-type transport system substrate-binding protein
MRVGLENDVQLDPSLADIYDPVAYLTCLNLLRYTSTRRLADSRLVPEAAVAMPHLSRDHKTYVFSLRRGLRFSNGSPVTAANYAAAIQRILNPAMRSPGAQGIADIIASVRARRLRLTVTLKRPAGDFLARVGALSFACPIPSDLPVNQPGSTCDYAPARTSSVRTGRTASSCCDETRTTAAAGAADPRRSTSASAPRRPSFWQRWNEGGSTTR